jgi:hypothetical protein
MLRFLVHFLLKKVLLVNLDISYKRGFLVIIFYLALKLSLSNIVKKLLASCIKLILFISKLLSIAKK